MNDRTRRNNSYHDEEEYRRIKEMYMDKEDEELEETYNDKLSQEQQQLKQRVVERHKVANKRDIIDMTQKLIKDLDKINYIILIDKEFNNLFIFANPSTVLEMIDECDNSIDFSFLYAVKDYGSEYYAIDEYTDEVTDIVKNIAEFITHNRVTDETLKQVKGINIFENHYRDF